MLVHLATKTDVEVLEQAIRENEAWKDTLQVTVPKLRNPRIIAYDVLNEVQGTDVVKAACEQAKVDEDSVVVKFSTKKKETNH